MRMKLRGPAAIRVNPHHMPGIVDVGAAAFEGFDADAAIEEVGSGAQGGRSRDLDMAGFGEGAAAAVGEAQALEALGMSAMAPASSQLVLAKLP